MAPRAGAVPAEAARSAAASTPCVMPRSQAAARRASLSATRWRVKRSPVEVSATKVRKPGRLDGLRNRELLPQLTRTQRRERAQWQSEAQGYRIATMRESVEH